MGKYKIYRDYYYLSTKEELKIINSYNPTEEEMKSLNEFIKEGGSFDENPYMIYGESGHPMNFIDAYRFLDVIREEWENEQLQQANQ